VIDINKVNAGVWIKDGNGVPWIKIKDDDEAHIDGMVINLFDGSGRHISKLIQPIEYTNHSEVMW
jgi:hypothetical protein